MKRTTLPDGRRAACVHEATIETLDDLQNAYHSACKLLEAEKLAIKHVGSAVYFITTE